MERGAGGETYLGERCCWGDIMGKGVLVGRQLGEGYWWGDIIGRECWWGDIIGRGVLVGRHTGERDAGGET